MYKEFMRYKWLGFAHMHHSTLYIYIYYTFFNLLKTCNSNALICTWK